MLLAIDGRLARTPERLKARSCEGDESAEGGNTSDSISFMNTNQAGRTGHGSRPKEFLRCMRYKRRTPFQGPVIGPFIPAEQPGSHRRSISIRAAAARTLYQEHAVARVALKAGFSTWLDGRRGPVSVLTMWNASAGRQAHLVFYN